MPIYKYYCPTKGCRSVKEIIHMMSECDTPSKLLIEQTTCKKHQVRMQRQIFEPILQGSVGGTFPSEDKLRKQKQKERKARSTAHFVNEEMNKVKDRDSRRHFQKKYKGVKVKDHEKL